MHQKSRDVPRQDASIDSDIKNGIQFTAAIGGRHFGNVNGSHQKGDAHPEPSDDPSRQQEGVIGGKGHHDGPHH